jgi:PEP-CTERM motif
MNLRNSLLAIAVGGALGAPSLATAALIDIDGITIEPGSIIESALVWEGERKKGAAVACDGLTLGCGDNNGLIDQIGEELIGIGRISAIRNSGGTIIWDALDSTRSLTFYFRGYYAEQIMGGNIGFTGGVIDLYSDVTGAAGFNTPSGAETQQDGIDSVEDGNHWLSLVGSPVGIDPVDGAPFTFFGTEYGSISDNPLTLFSRASALGGAGVEVFGLGMLDVTGGPAAPYLDTDTFVCIPHGAPFDESDCPDFADKTFTSEGDLAAAGSTWGFFGELNINDNARAIPEPTTLALLGLGLVGMGVGRRSKKA